MGSWGHVMGGGALAGAVLAAIYVYVRKRAQGGFEEDSGTLLQNQFVCDELSISPLAGCFKEEADIRPEKKKGSGPQLSQWVTFGNHLYRYEGQVAAVEFVNEEYYIRKLIVDDNGYILNYPGLENPEEWLGAWESKRELEPQIRFRTDFRRMDDNTILMVWEIQPDGRYWEDEDGFGGESDMEIKLYTYLDEKGNFTRPFRTYSIGMQEFYGGQRYSS